MRLRRRGKTFVTQWHNHSIHKNIKKYSFSICKYLYINCYRHVCKKYAFKESIVEHWLTPCDINCAEKGKKNVRWIEIEFRMLTACAVNDIKLFFLSYMHMFRIFELLLEGASERPKRERYRYRERILLFSLYRRRRWNLLTQFWVRRHGRLVYACVYLSYAGRMAEKIP